MGEAMLDGKCAVVTGAGRGLGRHFAMALAERGMRVAVVGRASSAVGETARLIEADGGSAHVFHADVRDETAATAIVSEAGGLLGPVGVLINNAGTMNLGRIATID